MLPIVAACLLLRVSRVEYFPHLFEDVAVGFLVRKRAIRLVFQCQAPSGVKAGPEENMCSDYFLQLWIRKARWFLGTGSDRVGRGSRWFSGSFERFSR